MTSTVAPAIPIRRNAAPLSPAAIIAGLFIEHDVPLTRLPDLTAALPSAADLERGIRAEHARLTSAAS